jgi:hypothetical protein
VADVCIYAFMFSVVVYFLAKEHYPETIATKCFVGVRGRCWALSRKRGIVHCQQSWSAVMAQSIKKVVERFCSTGMCINAETNCHTYAVMKEPSTYFQVTMSIVLEKLLVAQVVKDFRCEAPSLISLSTWFRHFILNQFNQLQTFISYFFTVCFNIILILTPKSNIISSSRFLPKLVYDFLFPCCPFYYVPNYHPLLWRI